MTVLAIWIGLCAVALVFILGLAIRLGNIEGGPRAHDLHETEVKNFGKHPLDG